jgi:hypothetical protein
LIHVNADFRDLGLLASPLLKVASKGGHPMTMESETTLTHPDDANVFPTHCPWCLAVAALVLTAAMMVLFFW